MSAKIITYHLNDGPDRNHLEMFRKIETYLCIRLSEHTYAVSTTDSPITIFKELNRFLGLDDHLYIITLEPEYEGKGTQEAEDWLNLYLGT